MAKRRRPAQHFRRILTKKGRKRVLVNKGVRKKRRNYGAVIISDPNFSKFKKIKLSTPRTHKSPKSEAEEETKLVLDKGELKIIPGFELTSKDKEFTTKKSVFPIDEKTILPSDKIHLEELISKAPPGSVISQGRNIIKSFKSDFGTKSKSLGKIQKEFQKGKLVNTIIEIKPIGVQLMNEEALDNLLHKATDKIIDFSDERGIDPKDVIPISIEIARKGKKKSKRQMQKEFSKRINRLEEGG